MRSAVILQSVSVCRINSSQRQTFASVSWLYKLLSAYPGVSDFELPQNVLGHVILGHGVHHKVLVSRRPLRWPVLVAFFLLGGRETMMSHSILYMLHSWNLLQWVFFFYLPLESVCFCCFFYFSSHAFLCAALKERSVHTLPISLSLVSITTIVELCSQSILQKSSVVSASGPCVAM